MDKLLFCTTCDELVTPVLKPTQITHHIKGEAITLTVEIPHCVKCGNQLADLAIEEQHFDAALAEYRRSKKLLPPSDIKTIREKYGLSQRAFARALGFSEPTINRYELGALPDNSHNNILLLAQDAQNMLRLIDQNRENLSPKEYTEVKSTIDQLLSCEEASQHNHLLVHLIEKLHKMDTKLDQLSKELAELKEANLTHVSD